MRSLRRGSVPISRASLVRTERRQLVEGHRHSLARRDQIGEQLLIDIEGAFVFAAVAEVVASREYSPYLRPEPERVGKDLKDDVAIRGPVPRMPQRGQTQRMGGIVGEIEATLRRIRLVFRVGEPSQP